MENDGDEDISLCVRHRRWLLTFTGKAQTEVVRARHTIIWPRLSYKQQFKEGDEEADRGNDGKTTSKGGLALNGISYYGKLRTARS